MKQEEKDALCRWPSQPDPMVFPRLARAAYPDLTLMQCGEPEASGMYLCLMQNHLGRHWRIVEWIEHHEGMFAWYNAENKEVVAWQSLPQIPTEEQLEMLYKLPVNNDE